MLYSEIGTKNKPGNQAKAIESHGKPPDASSFNDTRPLLDEPALVKPIVVSYALRMGFNLQKCDRCREQDSESVSNNPLRPHWILILSKASSTYKVLVIIEIINYNATTAIYNPCGGRSFDKIESVKNIQFSMAL